MVCKEKTLTGFKTSMKFDDLESRNLPPIRLGTLLLWSAEDGWGDVEKWELPKAEIWGIKKFNFFAAKTIEIESSDWWSCIWA